MSNITIEEAKIISQDLRLAIMQIKGTKNEDGSTNTVGLIEKLQKLYDRLNPESVAYLQNLAREKALESLEQIEKKLEQQNEIMNDKLIAFELSQQRANEIFAKKSKENLELIGKNADDLIKNKITYAGETMMSNVSWKFNKLLEELDEREKAKEMNYIYIIISLLLGMGVGVLVGLWL